MDEREDRRHSQERQPQIDPAQPQQDQPRALHPYLFAAIVAFAFNLRPGLVTIGPLLPDVQRGLALSPFAIGALTALPVLAFGGGSAIGDRVGRRLGWGRAMIVTALLIATGIATRSIGTPVWAYAGALLLGTGIGFGAVLVPALLKARARRLGAAMGAYSFMLVASAAVSVALTPGFAHAFGGDWRPTLGVWALPALACALIWIPLRRTDIPPHALARGAPMWRSPLAWAVTFNMGLQSTLFYSLASWLPTLLIDRGLSTQTAALDLSLFYLPQIAIALAAPILLARIRRQDIAAAAAMSIAGVGLISVLYGPPAGIPWWCAVVGGALGAVFAFALTFMVLRSRTPQTAAGLAGMSQSVGYAMAASGPLVLGIVRATPDPRLASALWITLLVLGAIVTGAAAGRQAFVDP
jgi:CP family cyanate transporter-like MFS transporter